MYLYLTCGSGHLRLTLCCASLRLHIIITEKLRSGHLVQYLNTMSQWSAEPQLNLKWTWVFFRSNSLIFHLWTLCKNCSWAAATPDLDPVLRHLLVKRLLLLRIVQRVAETVAAAGSHPDAQADAGGVLLDESAHALHRAGGEGQRRPCRDEPTFDRPAWQEAVVFNPS